MASSNKSQDARDCILKDIITLAKVGAPGTCWMGSPSLAWAVLTGDNKDDLLIVAGQLGKGRVVAIAHNGYLDNFAEGSNENQSIKQLQANIKKWVSNGTYRDDGDVMVLHNDVDKMKMKRAKILVSKAAAVNNKDAIENQALQFVKAGGGMVLGSCPWGFLQLNPNKSMLDIPFSPVLSELNVGFNSNCMYGDNEGFSIPKNKAGTYDRVSQRGMKKLQASTHTTAKEAILEKISTLDLKGGVPGRIVVYGEQAEPILTGDKPCDVIVASGIIGSGRVVVISHDGVMEGFNSGQAKSADFEKLHDNIKMWVSGNKYTGRPHGMYNLANATDANYDKTPSMRDAVLLYWIGGGWDASIADKVEKCIRNGTGCVIAMCPWGWLSLNPGKSLEDMPYYNIMKVIGVCFTDDYYGGKPISISASRADKAHCLRSLQSITNNFDSASDDAFNSVEYLSAIPAQERQAKISPLLNQCEARNIARIQCLLPTEQNPIKSTSDKGKFLLYDNIMRNKTESNYKYPGVCDFPGDIPGGLPQNHKLCVSVEVESHTEDVHPTGYYMLPGEHLRLQVINSLEDFTGWSVIIGAHQDKLFHCSELKRHPNVVVKRPLSFKDMTVHTPFGGSIYLLSPSKKHCTLQLWLQNVIEAPYYNISDVNSLDDWPRRRMAPGLWADISGEFVNITLPAESVRSVKDPRAVMETWDRVIRAHFHLKGTDLRNHRRQWFGR